MSTRSSGKSERRGKSGKSGPGDLLSGRRSLPHERRLRLRLLRDLDATRVHVTGGRTSGTSVTIINNNTYCIGGTPRLTWTGDRKSRPMPDTTSRTCCCGYVGARIMRHYAQPAPRSDPATHSGLSTASPSRATRSLSAAAPLPGPAASPGLTCCGPAIKALSLAAGPLNRYSGPLTTTPATGMT